MSKTTTRRPRKTLSWEPYGPVRAVIDIETKNQGFGARAKFLNKAVMAYKGQDYPKLLERFLVLWEEKNGRPA